MEGCCSPLFSLFEEARGHGKDVGSATALSGHHDAHVRAPHAPLHDILKRGQLVPVHPVYAVHRAAVDGILQQQYALRLSCKRLAANVYAAMWQKDLMRARVSPPGCALGIPHPSAQALMQTPCCGALIGDARQEDWMAGRVSPPGCGPRYRTTARRRGCGQTPAPCGTRPTRTTRTACTRCRLPRPAAAAGQRLREGQQ